jgi:hypothetical protein
VLGCPFFIDGGTEELLFDVREGCFLRKKRKKCGAALIDLISTNPLNETVSCPAASV